jgi:Mu transposase, C-terminal domain
MLSEESIMDVLEAFDLTRSYRAAAVLSGVDHHTVARYVAAREAGLDPTALGSSLRASATDPYVVHIDQWVDRSKAHIRADVVHDKLVALGFTGSPRSTRRAVAEAKAAWRRAHGRVYQPWMPEPGLWLQWDYGEGPRIEGRRTVLFCAWLPWSRFRIVLPLVDRTLPSVISAWDRTFRLVGGAPTYLLTDNEKTVTTHHIARIPVRNAQIVSAAVYYGVVVRTCMVADPESKGGAEATVRIAKADVVPSEANLRPDYGSFAELEDACRAAMERWNARPHAITRRRPVEALEDERPHLHRIPTEPYAVAFGLSRTVSWSSTVTFEGARYSVPHLHRDTKVWVRSSGEDVVIVAGEPGEVREVARHRRVGAGGSAIDPAHYPERKEPADRRPTPTNGAEVAFLALGEGAKLWLLEAAAAGTRGIEARMAEAVSLAKVTDADRVDEALGLAAMAGRFSAGDLASICDARRAEVRRADPDTSLQPGTATWAGFTGGEAR